ncbi:type IV secretory system conjugative DNA transfer family protein, partial [Gordonia sihwensis]|uniref:type IV secretory system conjugative DNA transfer family protein n=1 Tax=Gordonia sihwensis TaxID=173559 RepID=UPI0005F0583E
PYAGWIRVAPGADGKQSPITHDERNEGRRHGDRALTPPHLIVSGETGGGKTRTVLGPNLVAWGPRPAVAMSSKGDFAELTIKRRAAAGPAYLLDLSGEVRESELQGVDVTRVRCDPCANLTSDDEALDLADLLMETGSLGAGDGGGGGDAAFWKALARRRLACFLLAGGWRPDPDRRGQRIWGGGVEWALNACETVGPDSAESTGGTGVTSEGLDEDAIDETDEDLDAPNWTNAYLRCLAIGTRHAPSLLAARAMDEKQRDSIGINCQVAMSSWALEAVATGHTAFEPAMLDKPGATLFIVSPSTGAGAVPASLTLVQIVNYWRKRVGDLDPILFVLDEVTNGSPIPAKRFLGWLGEGRSLGIRICAAVQNSDQFSLIWSESALRVLRNVAPAVLILPGANEMELLERAARFAIPEERVTASVGADGRASHARDRAQSIEVADLVPRKRGTGRLLLSGMQGVAVDLPDISVLGLD